MRFHSPKLFDNCAAPSRRDASAARTLFGLAAAALMATACPAATVAPAPTLEVTRSVAVAAPVDKVWEVVGNFGDLSYFSAAVERTEIVKGRNNQVGAQRRITLKDGGLVLETLTARKERPYRLTYRMDESKLPVSNYRSTISVTSSGQGSKVTWRGQFNAQTAAAGASRSDGDRVAVEAISGLYEAGLASIKTAVER